ncbi:monocarboxylate transporter 7-like isoform X2 [Cylas formicarius]|uniref:monocarboxylate transporter 7-like isoform X2 n=1 Tax=Cylas formicarius TaxID=197179 RepID=UPI0029586DD3|nr:monocarboxylate transporter 7-like isoform X2 [Cylas formicarius]
MGSKRREPPNNDEIMKYQILPPDGGWGYAVAVASTMLFVTTLIPMAAFGLVFGDFLKSVGDETTGTTLANGFFNTVSSFMGLVANVLLNMYSFRKVAFAGSVIFTIGTIGVVFAADMLQLIFFFGVVEGIGFGLIMPAAFSAFNSYFDKRMTLMMSISQAIMVVGYMTMPIMGAYFMQHLGFRGTLMLLVALTLLNFPSSAIFQPVKWHVKKIPIETETQDIAIDIDHKREKTHSLNEAVLKSQIEPLMKHSQHNLSSSHKSLHQRLGSNLVLPKPRSSIVSLGDRAVSVTTIHDYQEKQEKTSFWKTFANSMDMSLFKDVRYVNISLGLALCYTADIAFFPIIPLVLGNIGFNSQDIALMMFVYFASDLVARISLSVLSGFVHVKSRYLVLGGAIFSAIFRFAFVSNDTYIWKIFMLAILGFLRCFIQTPLPLVLSEEYPDKFATAFSLYMVVNGAVSLLCGPLMSIVKSYTGSDVMVCHVLTTSFGLCIIAWAIEMIFNRKSVMDKSHKPYVS